MDPDTPLEETMGALATAVQSGRALYAGLSNYNGPTLEKAAAILDELHVPFVINQNRYSIFDRTIEQNGLKETAVRLRRGIIAFSPLAQGLLTDRYLHGIPEDSRIRTDGRFLPAAQLPPERRDKPPCSGGFSVCGNQSRLRAKDRAPSTAAGVRKEARSSSSRTEYSPAKCRPECLHSRRTPVSKGSQA